MFASNGREARRLRGLPPRPDGLAHPRHGRRPHPHRAGREGVRRRAGRSAWPARSAKGEDFTLEDFLEQMQASRRWARSRKMLGMLPGMGEMKAQLDSLDERELDRVAAIIQSMTPGRARRPQDPQRLAPRPHRPRCRRRGLDVNQLVDRFVEAQKMMRQMRDGGGHARHAGHAAAAASGPRPSRRPQAKAGKGAKRSGNPAKRAAQEQPPRPAARSRGRARRGPGRARRRRPRRLRPRPSSRSSLGAAAPRVHAACSAAGTARRAPISVPRRGSSGRMRRSIRCAAAALYSRRPRSDPSGFRHARTPRSRRPAPHPITSGDNGTRGCQDQAQAPGQDPQRRSTASSSPTPAPSATVVRSRRSACTTPRRSRASSRSTPSGRSTGSASAPSRPRPSPRSSRSPATGRSSRACPAPRARCGSPRPRPTRRRSSRPPRSRPPTSRPRPRPPRRRRPRKAAEARGRGGRRRGRRRGGSGRRGRCRRGAPLPRLSPRTPAVEAAAAEAAAETTEA